MFHDLPGDSTKNQVVITSGPLPGFQNTGNNGSSPVHLFTHTLPSLIKGTPIFVWGLPSCIVLFVTDSLTNHLCPGEIILIHFQRPQRYLRPCTWAKFQNNHQYQKLGIIEKKKRPSNISNTINKT